MPEMEAVIHQEQILQPFFTVVSRIGWIIPRKSHFADRLEWKAPQWQAGLFELLSG